jgi:hypothetical protein
VSEPQDQPATLTDDDIETRRIGALDARAGDDADDTGDTGDDTDDTTDTSDTGDDSGDSTDTGDDS